MGDDLYGINSFLRNQFLASCTSTGDSRSDYRATNEVIGRRRYPPTLTLTGQVRVVPSLL